MSDEIADEVLAEVGEDADVETLVAAIQRARERNGGRAPQRGDRRRDPANTSRSARKCPNCGEEHKELKCPKPSVPISEWPCWTCGKKGHGAKDCPERGRKPIKHVDEGKKQGVHRLAMVVEADGYSQPRRPARPQPHPITVSDFVHVNRFAKLSQKEQKAKRRQEAWQAAIMEECDDDEEEVMCHIIPEQDAPGNVQREPSPVAATLSRDPGPRKITSRSQGTRHGLLHPKACECSDVSLLEHANCDDAILATAPKEVTVSAAADTGAVASCLHPDQLPDGAMPCGNKENRHFTGAGGEHIESYGKVDLLVNNNLILGTNVCEVNRALHSISQIAGPEDGPGVHDVVFTNKRGVVLPAGLLDSILQKHKPVLEYERRGGLYVTDIKLSSFTRQDQAR